MIDWSTLNAEDILSAVTLSPSVAGVWQYFEISRDYKRNLKWDPKRGLNVSWLTVARIGRGADTNWWAYYDFDNIDNELGHLGPFKDRFEAAAAMDVFLETRGWKLCR